MIVYDMHSHLYEYSGGEVSEILDGDRGLIIVAVSDDLDSLRRTYELYESYPDRIIPCVGYHPWNFRGGGGSIESARSVARMGYRLGLTCIGEVGLDKRFVPLDTWSLQVEVFNIFIRLALDMDGFLNIHSPGAWREALMQIKSMNVPRAMFHWYTGPRELIDEVINSGYYISINPALRIQEKHRRIAEYTPLDYIVFESDSPYNYRGLKLHPHMVRESIKIVAGIKGVGEDLVYEAAYRNSIKLIKP